MILNLLYMKYLPEDLFADVRLCTDVKQTQPTLAVFVRHAYRVVRQAALPYMVFILRCICRTDIEGNDQQGGSDGRERNVWKMPVV
jgi:hypothetical protein